MLLLLLLNARPHTGHCTVTEYVALCAVVILYTIMLFDIHVNYIIVDNNVLNRYIINIHDLVRSSTDVKIIALFAGHSPCINVKFIFNSCLIANNKLLS